MTNYNYKAAHYPNNVSWYRELVYLDDQLVAEINEPADSTFANKIYNVRKYETLQVADDVVYILGKDLAQFNTVCDCKDYINNGGIK